MSRFLRFFRVFVVAIICGFGVFTGAFSAQPGVTLDDQGAISAGAPHNIGSLSPNTQLLTDFPYKPGYGFAGYYTQTNCGGNRILTHEGKWSGTQYNGTVYACWVPLVYVMSNGQPSPYYKLFVLDGNGGTTGNMWPRYTPIVFSTNDGNYGGNGRAIRFENRGDWVYLWCQNVRNNECSSVLWMTPHGSAYYQYYGSATELFTINDSLTKDLPQWAGNGRYVFGGYYSSGNRTSNPSGVQYCDASGNTNSIMSLWNNSLTPNSDGMYSIYARWNAMTVNLSGNYATPGTVYFDGSSWYSDAGATSPISGVTVSSNGNYEFGGYWTGENGTGVKVIDDEDGHLRTGTDVANAIYNEIILHPQWVAPSTWATLSINNQDGLRSVWKLYYPLSGCSILGYHTSQDCLNTNVVASLANWTGHWPVEKDGWSYGGHWTGTDGTGTQYIDDDNGTLLTAITNSTTVYAKWSFSVAYAAGTSTGGSAPSGPIVCTYGTACNAPENTYTNSNMQFAGWACSLVGATGSCAKTKYAAGESLLGATNNVNGATGITLTATWTSNITYYKLTLDSRSGFGGNKPPYIYEGYNAGFYKENNDTNRITASIFAPLTDGGAGIARPTKAGYAFYGYWTGVNDGEQIIDKDGIIKVGPDRFTSATTLYAHWLETQTVPLDLGEHGSWGTCGITSIQVVPVEPPLESQLSCVPTADTGWNFIGYYDSDSNNATQYYDANGYAVYPNGVWPASNAPTGLVARYEAITHTVNYYCKKGNGPNVLARTDNVRNGDQYTVWNGEGVDACANTAATSGNNGQGSKLVGWGNGSTGNSETMAYSAGANFDSFTITDDMDLSMVQKPIYYVTLNHCNDSSCSSYPVSNSPNPSVVYFSNGNWYSDALATAPRTVMNPKPDRLGYTFGGYNTASNGTGTMVVNNSGAFVTGDNISANSSTIYAQWTVLQRQITLVRDGGDGGPESLWHQIDKWSLNQGGDSIVRITAPTKSNNSFAGYWIKDGGEFVRKVIDSNGDILFFGQNAAELIDGMAEPRKFYARWDDMPSAPTNPNDYFAVTTIPLVAGDVFTFGMSAEGSFYVDWGDGTVEAINRSGYINRTKYSHTYASAAPNGMIIKIWAPQNGGATGYSTAVASSTGSAISFGGDTYNPDVPLTPTKVAGISGSLGAVFPTLNGGGSASNVPGFHRTFAGCTNLTGAIPYGLFSGITGNRGYMFYETFFDTGVTGISGTVEQQSQLFSGIYGAAELMFSRTFGYTNITSIPENLFGRTINGTYQGVSGAAPSMFEDTFSETNITSIPAGLFSGISGAADRMFYGTFYGTNITSLPHGLFSGVTGTAQDLFTGTFNNCASLTGYIPKDLFNLDGLEYNPDNNMMLNTFVGFVPDCGSYNLTWYQTDFDSYWNGAKICAPAAEFSCGIGTGTAPNPIFVTPVDSGSVSFTFPSGTNCTAPAHYTKNNTWTCNGNVCNNGATSWSSNGQTPFNGTWNGQQSVTFYMTYTPDVYTIVLNQNHSSNDNTTVSGSPIKERYGDTWLDSNGVILDPQKAHVPSNWTNNNTTYNFNGYFTSRSGGTRMTTNDGTFVNDAATHTVGSDGTWYAQWDDSNNVTFKCEEGGSAINGYSFTDVQNGDSINVPATSVCTKTGYTFTQWKIVANGVLIDETNNGGTYTWNYNFGSDVVPNWQLVETTITLDKHGGTGGTSALYTRYGVGVYRDSGRTQEMKVGENPLTAPNKSVTLTLSLNDVSDDPDDPRARVVVNNQVYTGSVGLPYDLGFKGYYSSASSTTKYIESTGFITAGSNGGMQTGAGYTSNETWHAQWNPSTVVSTGNMPVPTWAGHVFNGWWTAASGGIQITDGAGAFVGDGSVPTINANTTWHAQWTGCSHDFGANPNAGKTPIAAVNGMCGYHITCAVPGNGYSQHGGNDTTGAFDFYILPSSTDTLPGCSPRVYVIQYALMGVSATLPQSGTPGTYTYGVVTSITGAPSSEASVFQAWCTDAGLSSCVTVSQAQQQGYYYQIGNTTSGDKIYYAKWSDDCVAGYMKYSYDVTVTADYDNQSHYYPEGVCAPGNYVITCNNNCPTGETCNACLENILSSSYHFGQRYGVYSQKFGNSQETYDGVVGALGIVLGGQNYNWTFPFGASSYIRPAYSLAGIGDWVDNMNLPSSSVFGQNDYVAYMTNLAQLNGKTFGRAHYSFNGLWTHQTSEEEQYRYLPTVNDTTPWSQRNADGKTLSKFFTSDATVYAHWIPDVYTITLNANGGVLGNVTVLKEKWNTGWSKDNGASYQTAANFVALIDSERPVRTGHTFAGYYTERQTQVGQSCPGTKIVNADGSLNANASSSTGTVDNAKYFGANGSTLYACWTANNYYVTLKPNLGTGANGTSNDTTIYTKYMTGVYTNSGRTLQMTPNPNGTNPVSLPERYFTITYNPNYTGGATWTSDVSSTFNGYYSSAMGGTPYIDNTGHITPTGDSTAQGYTVNTNKWYAQWTNGSHDLLLTHYNGYFMDGWYDAAENGNKVGEYMGTITPTSNMTLYAHWTACDWHAGDHSTAQYVNPVETDGNVCKYHITCDSGYTHNGNSQFDEVKDSASGTTSLPGCTANEYTITYYDNPAYGSTDPLYTQGYTYSSNGTVTLWTPGNDSDVWAVHHASSVVWCHNSNGTDCEGDFEIPANSGSVVLYAKWTCATGYRTYAYVTDTNDYDTDVHVWPAGTCAPSRYRIMCNKNCPTYQQNGQNVTEICNACLEDFKLLSSSDTIGKYSFGSVYNGMAIGQTSCDGMVAGDLLPVPIYEKNNPTDARLFTKSPDSNYEFEACWVQRSDALFMAYGSGNYKTFMEALADQSYNSSINLNFGATHYDFDGLWTAASGGEQYISANGLSPEDEDAFNTQEMSKFFTSDTDVYAHWEPKVYPITLCPENGTSCSIGGGMSGGGKLYQKWSIGWRLGSNGNFKVAAEFNNNPISIPTYDGYNFMGYYTEQQTGTSCQGTKIINADGKLNTDVSNVVAATQFENGTTLYACWQSSAYTVTYNCGDGTGNGSVDNTPRYGQSYTPKAYADVNCERPSNGYYFNGWNVTPGTDIKPAGVAFDWRYMENKTFTAHWVAKEYHITFDKKGGSGGTNEVWEHYGASGGFWHDAGQNTITEITLPTNPGHTFAGYALTINGAPYITGTTLPDPTFDFGDTSNNSTVDITLVAQWDANTYNVRYNLDGGTTTLQVGYVPVEYITFTGTQVIDTGLEIKKGYEIQTKFYPTDTGKYVYGALSSGNSKTVSGYVSTAGGNWRWGNKAISKTMSLNSTYTIVQNASALTVNGVPVAYGTQDNFETGGVTLSIGKAHSASGGDSYDASGFKGRMYWFTIRDDNGNVVYHGVPVKNTANNQYGLCNIIDGTCLTASGINGATATLPATYNHGTATTVSGSAARANSVFNSWCSSPSSNCNSTQTIPATATGDKTFYAKWTCDAGYSYSSGGACVANTITLDWNENGGIGLTNGSCTYNGDLTLGVAPTYANHVFNGWKLANNTYGGASTTVNGGCVQAYTGVTSGTSTAITAQWCNACNPTNATCELNATAQPGTCTYTTSCNTGYHLSPDSQLNVYNTVCIPYTITYQSDGHGDGVTDEVLHNSTFTTNDAKNSSQFNWDNHIVTAWTTVSGGNFPNLGAEYTYNVQSDTVLKANWGQCHCTPGTGATNCNTTSSNNECEVDVITCNTGFTGSTWSCDGINCTASCNNDNRHTITLNKNNGTGGTTTLYTIYGTGSDAGVYINSARTNRMTPNPNGTYPITAPTLSRTVSYDITSNGTVSNASFAQQPTSANTSAVATFNGYYDSITGTEQYIEDDGYINATGVSMGKGYTTNKTWYAQWTNGSVTLPNAYRPGYTLDGWSTTVGGASIGNAGDAYTTGSNVTLYPVWTQCAAGKYCPGVETVNGSTVYNQIHNCPTNPTNYSNSAAGSTMISDCYLVLTPGKYVSTAGNGMSICQQNYYCDGNGINVYYSDAANDGRVTTWAQKSCATNAGSFSLTDGMGKTSINACYKNVTLNKRGGNGTLGGASGINDGSTPCGYNQNCTLPDASILQLTGHTFHGGWSQTDADCNSTTRVFVVPDEVNTYYACRTPNSYEVTLADGLNTNEVLGTIRPTYGAAMPSVDSNGNALTVPTKIGVANTIYDFAGYYNVAQTQGASPTAYYNYDLTSATNWTNTTGGTLYAWWNVTCAPGYYLPSGATSCSALCPAGEYCPGNTQILYYSVPSSSNQGIASDHIAAGYYSTGGGTSATPTAAGNGCVSGNSCGLVAGGYYSTGGGKVSSPTNSNGCLSEFSCGVLGADYYSNGGGTNNAGACVTGQTCGTCPTKYRSNTDTAKTVITQCTAACGAGTQVATAETTTNNGCKTPLGNTWWSNAHTVAYGSASPTVTGVNENGVHTCANYYKTPNTEVADNHNEQKDCARSVRLLKNGGITVDGAQWPENVMNMNTNLAQATCQEGEPCAFGNPAELLAQTGYTFQNKWGTDSECANPVVSPITTLVGARYYACKVKNNYTLTYACGTGATGDAPNQQTNIHYGDTVSVSGAGGCAKTGHTFAGWAVSDTSDVITATTWPHDITWNYDGSKTFTAQWTANTYSISYVGNGGTAGSILPDGYTQLEYIESNGNQYIVTNFIPSSDFKHTIVFEGLSGNSNNYIAGTAASAAGRAGNVRINGSYINGVFGNDTSNGAGMLIDTTKTGGMSVLNGKSVLVLDLHNNATNSIILNGVQVANTSTARITSTAPMNLFALDSNYRSKIRLYSDTIEQNGVLVHNYVPAQNSDDVVGLYDTVTGVFLTNRGSGSFTPGNPVTAAYPNQYTYGVGATVTGGATRANSVFQGWCRTESLTNCAAPHEITTTDTGDMTLYAKWGCATGYHDVNNQCVANEFTLVYNKNGHGTQNTPSNQTCTYGQEIYLADSLSETGWWFDGWIIAGEPYLGGDTITCTEEYLGVMGGATMTTVNVTANWLPWCNKITLATNSNDATWPSGSITALYAKTRESGSTTDGKWYKDNGCTTEYTSADYAKVIPTRSGWAFRGFYVNQEPDAADISATQTNGADRVMTHTGAPTSITGRDFINGLNANTVLYAGWARDCMNPVAHGTCSRTIGQNTTYTTTCATGYHYDPAASESTYNPICVPNTITIILDKNGGTGTCGGQSGTTSGTLTCNYDGTCNTPVWGNTCTLSKTGKIFAGWNTAANGTGTQYGTATVAGDVQNMNDGTTSTTLYAVWENAVCNVANGSATVSVSGNTVACAVTCNNGYESNGIYTGQQHATSVTTGQCHEGTYDIRYHYDAEHGGALASLLPEGDERVQYIQNAASTYVRTGITPDVDNVEVNLRFYQKGSGNSLYLLQSRASSGGTIFGISGSLSGSTINAVWNGGSVRSDISRADGHVYTVNAKFVNGVSTLYVRDETSGTEATNTGTYTFAVPSSPFGLFGNYGGNMIGTGQRVYSASIKVNGVVVMDYIPAVRNSVAGFYDVISGEFKGAYTGSLSAGATVTVAHPNQYTYGTGATVYGGATRANSVFEGWCRNAALTDGCTMVPHVIGTTEYGDKDLYAKWSCVSGYHLDGNNQCVGNTITINYQNGGHGGTPNPLQHTCVYGSTRNLAGAMGEVGYAFIGWGINNEVYDASENITCDYDTLGVYGGTIDSGTVIAEAQWDTVEYVVTYDCNTTWSNTTPESQYIRTGGTFRVRQNTCQNPGYRFVKWAVSGTSPQEYKNENEQFTWEYTENKIFSAVWERDNTNVFTVTVDMPANTAFKFTTIATGQFWVDWDDGSNIEEYAPTTITTKTWTHTYTTAGTYVIKIGGRATGYAISTNGTPERKSAISFFNGTLSSTSIDATVTANGTEQYITAVSGKLGNIFPTISAGTYGGQPRFYRTFKNTSAMNITLQSVEDLFDGLSGTPVPYMFAETFDGSAVTGTIPAGLLPVSGAPKTALFLSTFRNCAGLTGTIPANLFVNISGAPATQMFSRTFRGCDGLTGIPAGLFRNISGAPAVSMYSYTFRDCSNITGTLSSNLFGNINGALAASMFEGTFYNCTSLTGAGSGVAIPNGMFGTLGASTADARYAFYSTFYGCNALNGTIGGALFSGITGVPASHMFSGTFYGCSSLSGSIPQNLFGNMTGAHADSMFAATFQNCAGLTGPIPTGLFGTPTGAPAASMFKSTFSGCTSLTGAIPSGLFGNISGAPANDMFYGTFYNTAVTETIPANLFKGNGTGISGAPAENMFRSTFYGCSGLTGEIPNYLFGYISGEAASNMFRATFYNCSGLTGTIPENLFGGQNLTGTAKTYMFYYTFYGCGGLTGYVPEGLFGTITVPSSVPSGMMTYVFADSGLLTECPCGTTDISAENPFYTYWRSTSASANPKKVSCRVGLKPGEHWYNGICTTACSDTAIDELHVGNLDPYVVLADPVSTVKNLAVKHNNTICYVPVASGNGGTNSLNMKYGNTVYHADRPNDTPPAGFGQR